MKKYDFAGESLYGMSKLLDAQADFGDTREWVNRKINAPEFSTPTNILELDLGSKLDCKLIQCGAGKKSAEENNSQGSNIEDLSDAARHCQIFIWSPAAAKM
jgi:hypothetical protein